MNKTFNTYLKAILMIAFFTIIFGFANSAEARNRHNCGNFEAYGFHQTGDGLCAQAGGVYCQGYCTANPYTTECGYRPTCSISNFCQGGDVWRTETACTNHSYQACLYGCNGGVCNSAPTPTPATPACIPNQPCTSLPNSCGLTNGVKSCATNTCIAPPNALCLNTSCLGPDGVTIVSGESRTYSTSATDCTDTQTRTCTNGVLSGSYTSSTCLDNTGALPEIKVFRMAPSIVNKDYKCTMVWEVDKAQVCTITGPGIPKLNAKIPSGTAQTASTTASNTYKITCSNTKGSVEKSAICRLNATVNEN